jgi:hypothetical protein
MNTTIVSAAMTKAVDLDAGRHLLRADGQEDLCFAVWQPSEGRDRTTALIREVVLPLPGEREVHGNASFSAHYFQRALAVASARGGGLAFMHSHLGPGWQAMSNPDYAAEASHAAAAVGATGLPLVGLTVGMDHAWSARFWLRIGHRVYEPTWCEKVRVVGQRLALTYCDALLPTPRRRASLARTISVWGDEAQADFTRLRIGVIGAGSVGSIVTEELARMGVQHVRVIDFDSVEELNLDRVLHATADDAELWESKVAMLARAVRKSATAAEFKIDALPFSVVEEDGYRTALDCDVLFSCVDRPWARSVLNMVAIAHLIPVIDGGIAARMRKGGGIGRADWRAHVVTPGRRCMECLGQYDPGFVDVERTGYLDDPMYIQGLPTDHVLRQNQNVFAFSVALASLEVLQLLAMTVDVSGLAAPGAQMYHFVPLGRLDRSVETCAPSCPYVSLIALGDRTGFTITGRHAAAVAARHRRVARARSVRHRVRLLTLRTRRAIEALRGV